MHIITYLSTGTDLFKFSFLYLWVFFQVKIYSFRLISYGLVVPACRQRKKGPNVINEVHIHMLKHTHTHTLLGPRPATMTSPAVCFGPLPGFGRGWGGMLKKPGEAKHTVLLWG